MKDKRFKPTLKKACLECKEEDCLACRRNDNTKNPRKEEERREEDGLDRSS